MRMEILKEIQAAERRIEELKELAASKGINVDSDIEFLKGKIEGLNKALEIVDINLNRMKMYF